MVIGLGWRIGRDHSNVGVKICLGNLLPGFFTVRGEKQYGFSGEYICQGLKLANLFSIWSLYVVIVVRIGGRA